MTSIKKQTKLPKIKAPIFIVTLLFVSCFISIFIINKNGEQGNFATITVSGNVLYSIDLNKTRTIKINGENNIDLDVKTELGYIWVEYSDCPDKICKHKGKISKTNENIVCLPAKVVIEIKSENNRGDFDAIT